MAQVYYLGNLGWTKLELGETVEAIQMLNETVSLAIELGDTPLTSGSEVSLAQALLLQGKPAEAARYLRKAYRRVSALEIADQANGLAWLGAAQLAMRQVKTALRTTRKAVRLQKKFGLQTVSASDFPPQEVWWLHYAVLTAWMKENPSKELSEETWKVIDQARELMLARIAALKDDGLRRNYFNKITLNRNIIQAWLEQATRRKMPLGPLTEFLSLSEDIKEPFKRLIEIGVRMNTRRNTEELAPYIINEVVELTGAERAALFLLEEDQPTGLLLPAGESESEFVKKIQPLLKQITRSGQPVLRYVPEKASMLKQRSIMCVPLTTAGKQVGVIYTEMSGIYGRFTNQDLDLLKVLANQAAVAIENAAWSRTLENKVDERTDELQVSKIATEQRNAELAVINSIQQGLAAELEFQAIVDLVGDKLREVLKTGDIGIRWYDSKADLIHYLYEYEHGQRLSVPSEPPSSKAFSQILKTRQPVIMNSLANQVKMAIEIVPGTDQSLSAVMIPIIGSDRVIGAIYLENYESENAFTDANVRLLLDRGFKYGCGT